MDRPSVDAFLESFDGRFYGPVGVAVVGVAYRGWRVSEGRPSSLGLLVTIDPRREPIVLENGLWPPSATSIVHELLFLDVVRPFRFPVLVERGRTRISVDGRARVFTTYTYRGHVVATAKIRGFSLTVGCRSRVLGRLKLGALAPDQVRQLVRAADRITSETDPT